MWLVLYARLELAMTTKGRQALDLVGLPIPLVQHIIPAQTNVGQLDQRQDNLPDEHRSRRELGYRFCTPHS